MSLDQLPPTSRSEVAWTAAAVEAALLGMTGRRRAGADRGPHRLAALLRELGQPQRCAPAVKVVGTDGKTSVTRLLSALVTASGRRVGATTSPHLERIDERIRIDAGPVDPDRLGWAVDRVGEAAARLEAIWAPDVVDPPQRLTFFEMVTAVALQVFADARVDLAVVEAGIGGVGDATAAVPADVVVLTPVGLDHPQLGSTLREVAREKAGVLPPGGTLVSASQRPEVESVLAEVVADRGGRWLQAGVDYAVLGRHGDGRGQTVTIRTPAGEVVEAWLPLWGWHQAENAATALAALHALEARAVPAATVRAALEGVAVPGRTELVCHRGGPEVVLDGAHDLPATDALIAALAERPVTGPTVVLLGATGGRDAAALAGRLAAAGCAIEHVDPHADEAALAASLARAAARTGPHGRVVVTGSLHLVGAVRSRLETRAPTSSQD